jgi:hypothetical protein
MRAPSRKETAVLARLDDVGAAETNREQWWHMLPLHERERALMVAGLPAFRAALPLATFSDTERERIRLAIAVHIGQMQLIDKCMAAHNTGLQGWLH